MLAANVLARAIARGIYEATALPFPGALPSWRDRFDETEPEWRLCVVVACHRRSSLTSTMIGKAKG
jgi:hypothetical protein